VVSLFALADRATPATQAAPVPRDKGSSLNLAEFASPVGCSCMNLPAYLSLQSAPHAVSQFALTQYGLCYAQISAGSSQKASEEEVRSKLLADHITMCGILGQRLNHLRGKHLRFYGSSSRLTIDPVGCL